MKLKEPTCTSLVMEALKVRDDFLTGPQIAEATRCSPNQVGASLGHLRKHKAVDCLACDGGLWWFTTPDSDDRCYHILERTPEVNKRKPRKSRKAVAL